MYYGRVASPATDTIPRLTHLVAHLRKQLREMRTGPSTFEQARLRYRDAVTDLQLAGIGRQTASRVEEGAAYWSSTAEVLEEAMRLGFVTRAKLPSARRYVDAYRSQTYALTDAGSAAADLADDSPAEFVDEIAAAAIAAHPYFRVLLRLLSDGPLVVPTVTQGEVARLTAAGESSLASWSAWAANRVGAAGASGADLDASVVIDDVAASLQERFGRRTSPPSAKSLAEALNDAFLAAALRARGLPIGATNFRSLRRWAVEMLLVDFSRHLRDFDGLDVTWLAADLDVDDIGTMTAHRRTAASRGDAVARALVDAYEHESGSRRQSGSTLASPYVPIHRVRAQAAFATRVTRALAELVLAQIVDGEREELGIEAQLHLTGEKPPASEPVYVRGGRRRYELTMMRAQGAEPR